MYRHVNDLILPGSPIPHAILTKGIEIIKIYDIKVLLLVSAAAFTVLICRTL